jgi:hypothetical protein
LKRDAGQASMTEYLYACDFTYGLISNYSLITMLLIIQHLNSYSISFGSVIVQLDWAIQGKELDYPVKPDNDNHWNRVRFE